MPFEILEVVCVESRTDARCLAEHSGNLFLVLCRCVLGLLLVPADSLCLLCFGHGTLSIFLLEFIIPKSQQKRRYVSSIDHTHHIRQEEYDGKEGQHDNGCAPVKMLIWSKHERQQQGKEKPCGCYDRTVFGKPFVDDGVIQEEELAHECYPCEQGGKENTKPSVFASIRKAITANIVNAIAAVNVWGRSMIRKVSLGRFIVGLMLVIITVHQ